ncbi:MAG: hypothetical protein H7235_08985 [Bdellovibrionaceae bacterium]|nr:hypothetical protein [Pseudobdellovibrionaceae bacterium]
MRTYSNKTLKNKILFITILWMCLSSCGKSDSGFAPSGVVDAEEISATDKVISGNYEIQGTTEEIVDTQVSGAVTIEGVFNE